MHKRKNHFAGVITTTCYGKDNKNLSTWLESMNLGDNQRLAEFLDVESGWIRPLKQC